jgi:hypothetical protein
MPRSFLVPMVVASLCSIAGCSGAPSDPLLESAPREAVARVSAAQTSDVCFTSQQCPPFQYCDPQAGACGIPNVQGSCKPIAGTCIPINAPVCGCNGVTYANDCVRIQNDEPLAFEGACPPPLPPQQFWDASCRVVLETIWGADITSYYGTVRDETSPDRAVQDARAIGQSECESARNGAFLEKCTVDNGQCAASPAPR